MKKLSAFILFFILASCGAKQAVKKPSAAPEDAQRELWQLLRLKTTGDTRVQYEEGGLLYDAEVYFLPGQKPGRGNFIMSQCPVDNIVFTVYDAKARKILKEYTAVQGIDKCAGCHKQ